MPAVRYMRKGVTKLFFVPTIASAVLVPTAAEVNAGVSLSPQLATLGGFSFANQPITVPDMDNTFEAKIPGQDAADDSNLTFYELKGGSNPIYTALPKGAVGYVVIFPVGIAGATPAAADVADVWPVQVGSRTRQYTADNEAAKYMVAFTPTSAPGFDKVLT